MCRRSFVTISRTTPGPLNTGTSRQRSQASTSSSPSPSTRYPSSSPSTSVAGVIVSEGLTGRFPKNQTHSFLHRKPFLAVCMAGKILGAIFNLLNAIFLNSWSRWVWLATVMPIQNISGGYLTFIMMTYSFIADNSTNRQKYKQQQILHISSRAMGTWRGREVYP